MTVTQPTSSYGDPSTHLRLGKLDMDMVAKWASTFGASGRHVQNALNLVGRYSPDTRQAMEERLTANHNAAALVETTLNFLSTASPTNYVHTMRVTDLALVLAVEMNKPAEDVANLCIASLLHDAGKLATPDELLHRRQQLSKLDVAQLHKELQQSQDLSDAERCLVGSALTKLDAGKTPSVLELIPLAKWESANSGLRINRLFRNLYGVPSGNDGIVRNHVVHSEYLIRQLATPPAERGFVNEIATIAGDHHELLAGNGYPDGLAGQAIHPLAKILAVADKFESATAVYGKGNSLNFAGGMAKLKRLALEGQIDPEVFAVGAKGAFTIFQRRGCPSRVADFDAIGRDINAPPHTEFPPMERPPFLRPFETVVRGDELVMSPS